MKTEEIKYSAGSDFTGHGYLAVGDGAHKRPGVIIAHAWRGQDDFVREKAKELAALGYVGFAADLYGNGRVAEDDDQAAALMKPLFIDRCELRRRIIAAFTELQKHPSVDPHNIGAIGFCFGGLTVIELLRSGVNVRSVVSFHGVLGNALKGMEAIMEPLQLPIKGSLMLLHGYKDPLVSAEDLAAIQKEFSDADVDWQLHIYGNAAHAFSNPNATDERSGLIYNAVADRRAWQSMKNFFQEQFKLGIS